MKILYIITQSSWGGAQRYVFDLASNLSGEHDVTVVCGKGGSLIDKLEKVEKVKLKVFNNLVREICPVKDFVCLIQLYKFIKREKFDVVHTNSTKAEILGNIAAGLAKAICHTEPSRSANKLPRIIFTAHGFVFNEPMSKFKRKLYIFLERLANKFSDKIICVSEFDKKTGIEYKLADEGKFVVINNGVNKFTGEFIPRHESGEKLVIGTIANFYPVKGLEYLIKAASILNRKYDNLEFQIIGDGAERESLEKTISNFQLSNFLLLGFKDNPDEYLKKFEIFVLPSLKEGFPYSVLEAMSLGLPIVASKVGGIPEMIDEEYLSKPGDENDLAEKLAFFIENNELRERVGKTNLEKVNQQFSLGKMIEKTKVLY